LLGHPIILFLSLKIAIALAGNNHHGDVVDGADNDDDNNANNKNDNKEYNDANEQLNGPNQCGATGQAVSTVASNTTSRRCTQQELLQNCQSTSMHFSNTLSIWSWQLYYQS
jgi:hypothetical protein